MTITHPDLQAAADMAAEYMLRFFRAEKVRTLFVMFGEPGCGKTHIARRMFRLAKNSAIAAWERGGWAARGNRVPESLFASWPRTCDQFKEGDYGMMRDERETDFLVIDDIGAEHDPSKNACEKLCQILSNREREFTVVTTNIKPEFWGDKFDARIADRLLRNSVIADMSAVPSWAAGQ